MKIILYSITCCILFFQTLLHAQSWDQIKRGAWLGEADSAENLVLVNDRFVADIVISPEAHSAVRQAAEFLAADIEKISGKKPRIRTSSTSGVPTINFATAGRSPIPPQIDTGNLAGKWEAYKVVSHQDSLWLIGSNPRGTAFAAYTFSERLGIDPLYHWIKTAIPSTQEELLSQFGMSDILKLLCALE
ncbi:MAG: hypothetical protein AB8B95_06255 [Pseudohongiellaceae bacterium]